MVTKKFFLAALLISSERRLVSLTDSKHLYYELLAGCGGALDRGGGGRLEDIRLESSWLAGEAVRQRGREGGRGQEKTKLKVDELFTAGNNPGLTYSHSEHPKL